MRRPTFQDIRDLYRKLILPFHEIERDMPLAIRNHQNDNDAEHSWSLSFLAVALAPEVDASLDVGLVALYATIHDIVEVFAGDTSVWSDQALLDSKQQREAEASARIETEFTSFPTLTNYIKAYETKQTNEALFVYALDKFLNLLNLYEDQGYYYHTHKITSDQLKKQLAPSRQKALSHPLIATYYNELYESFFNHPEYFYEPRSAS